MPEVRRPASEPVALEQEQPEWDRLAARNPVESAAHTEADSKVVAEHTAAGTAAVRSRIAAESAVDFDGNYTAAESSARADKPLDTAVHNSLGRRSSESTSHGRMLSKLEPPKHHCRNQNLRLHSHQ